MTVRVTTLKGLEAGRYYTERLPGYYLNGQEPPGRWWGRAASDLGLSGQVDPEAFLAVMLGAVGSLRWAMAALVVLLVFDIVHWFVSGRLPAGNLIHAAVSGLALVLLLTFERTRRGT